MTEPLWTSSEWTFDLIRRVDEKLGDIAVNRYGLDIFPNQIEIITWDQMIDAYTTHAMPIMYDHWSFGKSFERHRTQYEKGMMGLAYEIVINSSPCISYLMEENTMTQQALVIAHACYGHNSFFKGNYLFQQWTDPEGIIDYLIFAREFIRNCEARYGADRVEELLDACHAIAYQGIDHYKRPRARTKIEEEKRIQDRLAYAQSQINDLWPHPTMPETPTQKQLRKQRIIPRPEENLLYFFEKKSPILDDWEREIVRIVRKITQYFWPQMQTKMMNEGWATTWHYQLFNDLNDLELVPDGAMIEFFTMHSGVIYQRKYNERGYSGINPYTLGFKVFQDIRRICENPDTEDRQWFPDLIGQNWLDVWKNAMANYKDESFLLQFLGPKVMRDLRLFVVSDNPLRDSEHYIVSHIHDDEGYRQVRSLLAKQYNMADVLPQIEVVDVDIDNTRALTLRHTRMNNRDLDEKQLEEVLPHIKRLWGFPIILQSWNPEVKIISKTYEES